MIIIGSDHRGYNFKKSLIRLLEKNNFIVKDVGTDSQERTDYPIFAEKVAREVEKQQDNIGVLICNNGVGMSIAANRFKGIRAGLVNDVKIAELAKSDDNINIIVLPVLKNNIKKSYNIINAVLNTDFKNERYQKRLDMLEKFE